MFHIIEFTKALDRLVCPQLQLSNRICGMEKISARSVFEHGDNHQQWVASSIYWVASAAVLAAIKALSCAISTSIIGFKYFDVGWSG